jgi:apolipoprotein N-acyltransferase
MGEGAGYTSFIIFWLAFEYIHLQDWGLSWPWLSLGNAFAGRTAWAQWYEVTGTSGGSLWVLLVNLLLYVFFIKPQTTKNNAVVFKRTLLVAGLLIFPILISFFIARSAMVSSAVANETAASNVVIIQPNINPYEKVATGTFEAQLQKLIRLSEANVDTNTTLLIWPETALYSPNGFDELSLQQNFFLNPLFDFLRKHPQLKLFTGIESYRVFDHKASSIARAIEGTSNFYEVYNGSVLLDSTGALSFYHKSMLVPGVETLPRFLRFLGPVFEKFGGTAGGYAGQAKRTPVQNGKFVIAPAICYESIYGEYMSRYVANGANLIAVITNDGWWGNTPGYKQHQLYAKLRAIETRKWVARSANTGISCVIDPLGKVYEPQPWWKEGVIKMNIPVTNELTFFVKYGDLISKTAVIATFLLLFYYIYLRIKKKIQ